MHSPLEAIDGAFEHAVFTTYSLNLHFFEHWVLPLLRKGGVRNTIVFADHDQLAIALADRSLRSLGRSYHVVSTRIGPGAFHPKLMFLSGEERTRICVSSANLTIDGQLRNLEAGVVLDSTVDAHRTAIADGNAFLRRVGAVAPPHTGEALLAALPEIATSTDRSSIRLVHNLDRPLVEHFPTERRIVAVSPFADTGAAARRLSERRPLELITDGDTFTAAESFFSGSWSVTPRKFERRLHGKVYWDDARDRADAWMLVGSPNLSAAALMRRADQGNTEIAVVFSPAAQASLDPGGDPWAGDSIESVATRRHLQPPTTSTSGAGIGSFNAWEDDLWIQLEGIPAGSRIEAWDGTVWIELGDSEAGRIASPTESRPYLIRAVLCAGTVLQTVVHRPNQLLQQRLRPRVTSRGADVISKLPLDLPGVRALEGVLADLYALDQIAAEGRQTAGPRTGDDLDNESEGLTDWKPAQPDDEPRVGDVYRRCWGGSPDALLALISSRASARPARHRRGVRTQRRGT